MTTKNIIQLIAKKNNVTPQEVENGMKEAIHAARMSSDPGAQSLWKELSPDGKEPTIDTFLSFCIGQLNARV